MREIITDASGEKCFEKNNIVIALLRTGKLDLNDIWALFNDDMFTKKDLLDFYQLIGYTLKGYVELFPFENIEV